MSSVVVLQLHRFLRYRVEKLQTNKRTQRPLKTLPEQTTIVVGKGAPPAAVGGQTGEQAKNRARFRLVFLRHKQAITMRRNQVTSK